MTDEQGKRLVAACQRMLEGAVDLRGFTRVEKAHVDEVQAVLDELPAGDFSGLPDEEANT